MTTAPLPQSNPPTSYRRTVLMPAVLLSLLVTLPWILIPIQRYWSIAENRYLPAAIDSVITAILGGWVVRLIARDRKRVRRHLQDLELLSLTDPLTGLGNRRALERDLDLALRRSQRLGQPLALLFLDVDDLKWQNDRFGHASGDETLRCLSAVLRSSGRLGLDNAYRVGGDEFVMVLSADRTGADLVAKRVSWAFHERSPRGSRVSMGVVVWDETASAADLIAQADSRMYRHKRPPLELEWV